MNDYFKLFQNITQSVEQTLKAEPSSIEIKQSATQLKQSVQPCLEELRQSTDKLNRLVQVCFDDLQHAEDVWNSKPGIAQAPTLEILEQIGELTGCDVRITQLGNKYRTEVIAKAKKSWEGWI
jgi:predicted DNA-binding transcriptional regulator YafY